MPNNTIVVIAGPGAGKTHNMVEKVLSALNDLKANKFCCVITYTNAATEVIRNRISKKIDIPPNLFIGTIHSFLNHFFIIPYFRLFFKDFFKDKLLESVNELSFCEAVKKSGNFANEQRRIASEFKTEKKLLKEGKICYRTSIFTAFKLSKVTKIIKKISNRIQFLYVDEYQDSDHFINEIFKSLINGREFSSFFIGDKKQKIHSTTSFPLPIRNKVTDTIDNLIIEKGVTTEEIIDNWRSSEEIVKFISNFERFEQIARNPLNSYPVVFINDNIIETIYTKFEELINLSKSSPENTDTFYKVILSESWKDDSPINTIILLSNFRNKYNLKLIENNMKNSVLSFYQMFEVCLVSGVNKNKKEIIEENFTLSIIEFRKFILKLIHKYTNKKCITYFKEKAKNDDNINLFSFYTFSLKKKFREKLKLENKTNGKLITCNNLINFAFSKSDGIELDLHKNTFCATIHKFKGLEATCVLVISPSNNILKKWLETNEDKQNKTSREGFVAFSRARKLLCISCLEDIDKDTKEKLKELDVKFSDEILETKEVSHAN